MASRRRVAIRRFSLPAVAAVCLAFALAPGAAAHETEDGVSKPAPEPEPAPAPAPAPSSELVPGLDKLKMVKPDGVFKSIVSAINERLQSDSCQWFNAAAALVLGLIMMLDGEFCFKNCVVGAIGIFVYLLALSEVKTTWPDHFNTTVEKVIAIEVALAVSFIAWRGYAGIPVLLGMLLGFVACFYLHAHLPASLADNSWFVVFYGNVLVISGLVLFTGKAHRRLTALISSVVGGLLVSSAVGFFVQFTCVRTGWLVDALNIPEEMPAWVDFVYALCAPQDKPSVGIFAHSSHNIDVGRSHKISLDFVVGVVMWFAFFALGLWNQIRLERKAARKKAVVLPQRDVPASSSTQPFFSNLKESLLGSKAGK